MNEWKKLSKERWMHVWNELWIKRLMSELMNEKWKKWIYGWMDDCRDWWKNKQMRWISKWVKWSSLVHFTTLFFISIKINQDQPNQRHEDSSNRPPVFHIGCLTPALGRGDPSRGPRCDSAWENWTRSRYIVWLLGKSQESTSLSQAK